MERGSRSCGSEQGLAVRWPVLGTSSQCSASPPHPLPALPLTCLVCLGKASFVVLTTIRWQAATLSGESKQYVFIEASRPRLDHGWVHVESLESFLWAPVPRRYLELTGFGSRHELYSSKSQGRFCSSPLMQAQASWAWPLKTASWEVHLQGVLLTPSDNWEQARSFPWVL